MQGRVVRDTLSLRRFSSTKRNETSGKKHTYPLLAPMGIMLLGNDGWTDDYRLTRGAYLVLDCFRAPFECFVCPERAFTTQEFIHDAAKAEPVDTLVVRNTLSSRISVPHLWRPIYSEGHEAICSRVIGMLELSRFGSTQFKTARNFVE